MEAHSRKSNIAYLIVASSLKELRENGDLARWRQEVYASQQKYEEDLRTALWQWSPDYASFEYSAEWFEYTKSQRLHCASTSIRVEAVRKAVEKYCRYVRYLACSRKAIEDRTSVMVVIQRRINQGGALPLELFHNILDSVLSRFNTPDIIQINTVADVERLCGKVSMPTDGDFPDVYSSFFARLLHARTAQLDLKFAPLLSGHRIPLPPYSLGLLDAACLITKLRFTITIHRYPLQLYLAQDNLAQLKQYFPSLKLLHMTIDESNSHASLLTARDKKTELSIDMYRLILARTIAHVARLPECDKRARVLWREWPMLRGGEVVDRRGKARIAVLKAGLEARIWEVVCEDGLELVRAGEIGEYEKYHKVDQAVAEEFEREMERKL